MSGPQVIEISELGGLGPAIKLDKGDTSSGSASMDKGRSGSIDRPSVNFGGGLELLMNEKRKPGTDQSSKGGQSELGLDDIEALEKDLNDLSGGVKKPSKSGLFNQALSGGISLNIDDKSSSSDNASLAKGAPTPVSIGKATAAGVEKTETWDGFGKFKNIPVDPDKAVPAKPKLSQEEMLREKFTIMRKLEELESKGVKLSKRYTMESSLAEMQGEYEVHVAAKEKSNSMKFQGKMLMMAITGMEYLNNKFDPFDVKLDGWGEQVNENISDYDEIFAELHDKYKSKAKMAPEFKLMFQLVGSAIMVHMTNTMFKSAMPGMDDIMRQNPELMQQFTQAAVSSMGQSNPGFGGFVNGMMSGQAPPQQRPPPPPNAGFGPPPPAMQTRTDRSTRAVPPPSRPDMGAARGGPGLDISRPFADVAPGPPERSTMKDAPAPRREMKGPTDIGDLLSGLKTKTVTMPGAPPTKPSNDGSSVSIQDLKEMSDAKIPSRSKRRQKSDKNTISLDI